MDVEAEKSAAKAVPVAAQTVTIPLEQFEEMARLIQDARSIVMETARPDSPLRMNIEGALQALTKDAMAGTLKQRMLCALDSRVPMLPPRVGPAANYMWRHSIMVYAPTGKFNYKKGVLQNSKTLFDSEPNVANIVELMRTYTQSGQPCTGAAYDYMNEQVCLPAFFR